MRKVAYALVAFAALILQAPTSASAGCYDDCDGYRGYRGDSGYDRDYDRSSYRSYSDEGPRYHTVYYERGQEAALVLARPLEQRAQGPGASLGGACATLAGQGVERAVHVQQAQGLVPRRRRALEGGVDGAPAQADASLGERAREVHRQQLRLASARLPEHVRDEPDLLVLLRGRAHALHERGERGERQSLRRRHPLSVSGSG